MLAPTLGRVEACEEDQIGRREKEEGRKEGKKEGVIFAVCTQV